MHYIDLDNSYDERYDMRKFLSLSSNCLDMLDSYFIKKLTELNPNGIFEVSGQGGRPDLVSYLVYGDVQYWWVIILFNKLESHESIVEGMTLEYPSIDALEDLYFILSTQERASAT